METTKILEKQPATPIHIQFLHANDATDGWVCNTAESYPTLGDAWHGETPLAWKVYIWSHLRSTDSIIWIVNTMLLLTPLRNGLPNMTCGTQLDENDKYLLGRIWALSLTNVSQQSSSEDPIVLELDGMIYHADRAQDETRRELFKAMRSLAEARYLYNANSLFSQIMFALHSIQYASGDVDTAEQWQNDYLANLFSKEDLNHAVQLWNDNRAKEPS